jgi:hypothetical protein
MPGIKVDVAHSLTQEVATERVKGLLNKLKDDYGDTIQDLKEDWNGSSANFSFKAMGMAVKGIVKVDAAFLSLDGQIPLTALPFKKMIETKIKEEAIKLLA